MYNSIVRRALPKPEPVKSLAVLPFIQQLVKKHSGGYDEVYKVVERNGVLYAYYHSIDPHCCGGIYQVSSDLSKVTHVNEIPEYEILSSPPFIY